ncbi:MAG: hypothetical protein E7081_00370 [Bacteroidales bacterium]|nr:hypothetical protein [Bacteroidales bacterium]
MIKFKRYYTALRRYKRSKGFGIHSPFAFNFVLKVLRERCSYYAYDDIHASRWQASQLATSKKERRGLISFKYAKMIFRITSYFNPQKILQIGTSHGIVSKTLLSVSSSSSLYTYLSMGNQYCIYVQVTDDEASRIFEYDNIEYAVIDYCNDLAVNEQPFIVINQIDKEAELIVETATKAINAGGVVIICNISRNHIIKDSWKAIKSSMSHGMSFSNDKIGVVVGHKHLPLQHYSLWF